MKYTRFDQIPQFPNRPYTINVGLCQIEFQLDHYKKSFNLQLNPDFQRGNVWTIDQQISYVEYLLKCPQSDSSISIIFNCPGWMDTYSGDMVCVDGLQRLTAVLDFLHNKIPVYGTYYNDFEDRMNTMCGLVFSIYGLENRAEVLKLYLDLNSGGTVHSEEELTRVKKLLQEELNAPK